MRSNKMKNRGSVRNTEKMKVIIRYMHLNALEPSFIVKKYVELLKVVDYNKSRLMRRWAISSVGRAPDF